jgi:hypothetical protein
VWLFEVAIFEGNTKRTFTASTDMTWKEFRDRVFARLDVMDVRLNFRLNVEARAWCDLSCEADLTAAMTRVGDKALVARTREVSMDVKNVVSNGPSITKDVLTFFCGCRHRRRACSQRVNERGLMMSLHRPQWAWSMI